MQQEDKISSSSHFVTLTYDTSTVPITPNGYMGLSKRDVQLFMKRLRKLSKNTLKYYAVGEYGTKGNRPHYHMILYNLEDVEMINKAWQKGSIHVGNVSGDSIAYTTKYIDKLKRIPMHKNDDRLREFSLMSKGIGDNYLTPETIAWHKADVSRNYIVKEGGYIIALPRYYRDKIFTDNEKFQQRIIIHKKDKNHKKNLQEIARLRHRGAIDGDQLLYNEKIARYNRFYSSNNKSRK